MSEAQSEQQLSDLQWLRDRLPPTLHVESTDERHAWTAVQTAKLGEPRPQPDSTHMPEHCMHKPSIERVRAAHTRMRAVDFQADHVAEGHRPYHQEPDSYCYLCTLLDELKEMEKERDTYRLIGQLMVMTELASIMGATAPVIDAKLQELAAIPHVVAAFEPDVILNVVRPLRQEAEDAQTG